MGVDNESRDKPELLDLSQIQLKITTSENGQTYEDQKTGETIERDKLVKSILQYSPSQLAELWMKNPPAVNELKPEVTIVDPNSEEKISAQKKLKKFEGADDYLELAFTHIKSFLELPRIKDGFVDHQDERRPWERGVLDALTGLTTNDGQKYNETFKVKWDENKYTRNKLFHATGYLEIMPDLFPPNSQQAQDLAEISKRAQAINISGGADGDALKITRVEGERTVIDYDALDQKVDVISSLVQEAVNYLGQD